MSVTDRGRGEQARTGLGWWMEPPILHASVTPLRQALCYSSFSRCERHSDSLSSCAKLPLLRSQIYEGPEWSIGTLCASSSNGTVHLYAWLFTFASSCCDIRTTFAQKYAKTITCMHTRGMKAGRNRFSSAAIVGGDERRVAVSASRALCNSHLINCIAAPALISFCGRLFALKISARHSASRHNAHVVVINHNYHGLKKPQLLFDFKNKP